ncbi:hypothetical protein MRB53_006531 [Persea americana]|uniref:Uncharacterized protein n=1 Tax=Persea americana TaxID=3435 RepID=A0ACC2MGP2_PERAE|nr:hypothetical protein MRB53_006531 [Persea americana]
MTTSPSPSFPPPQDSLKTNFLSYSTFLSLLQTYNENPKQVKSIHAQILKTGFQTDINLSTKLHEFYSSQPTPDAARAARNVFTCMAKPDVLSWNLVIKACSKNGQFGQCMDLYVNMQRAGFEPDGFTLPCVLNTCAGLRSLPAGQAVHTQILKSGQNLNLYVNSALVDMYAHCGRVDYAHQVFDEMGERDLVSWNSILSGFMKGDGCEEALSLFSQMRFEGVDPNRTTLSSVIPACGRLLKLGLGRAIHGCVVKLGDEVVGDVKVNSALVFMYSKCRDMDCAERVFASMPERNVVSWNSIISGFVQNERSNEAWDWFKQMKMEGVDESEITLTSMVMASYGLVQGRMMHAYVMKMGLMRDEIIGAALIDMYAKCGNLKDARRVFDEVPRNEMGSWNSMILGYVRNGFPRDALNLFSLLQVSGLRPNSITLVGVLSACADLGIPQHGRSIHDYIILKGIKVNLMVETALIDMYAKCGSVEMAREIFEGMEERDLVAWSVMISGHGLNGQANEAINLFSRMVKDGFRPDHVTFTSILSACSHAGLVQEGWDYFYQMTQVYGIAPKSEQYACMVDLLGRAGKLDEALSLIKGMPIEPGVSVWGALLGACRIHNNIELGGYSAEKLFELDPKDAGYYVLLSNLYAVAGRWGDVKRVRELMKAKGLQKPPGCSWVDLDGNVHEFYVGDKTHPQSVKIYEKLEELGMEMKELGYVADTNLVLHDVEEEVKEDMLSSHSERLAIAFGLINTRPGEPIRVTKNLRVCSDCHRVTKLISKIVGREIIVRDAHRFHHFERGQCSCGDYW